MFIIFPISGTQAGQGESNVGLLLSWSSGVSSPLVAGQDALQK